MAKDYAKFVPPKPRGRRKRWSGPALLCFLLLFIGCLAGGAVFYAVKSPQALSQNKGAPLFITKLVSFLPHHQKQNIILAKKSPVDDQPPPVRFDFYSQLPSIQVSAAETQDHAPLPPAAPVNKLPDSIGAPAAPSVLADATPVVQVMSSKPAPLKRQPVASPAVLNPDAVSGLLDAELTSPQQPQQQPVVMAESHAYFIQLGVFDTQPGAKRLAEALTDVGFSVAVTKVTQDGRKMYRVQQGPFTSIEMAKENQIRLRKRGIQGEITKV